MEAAKKEGDGVRVLNKPLLGEAKESNIPSCSTGSRLPESDHGSPPPTVAIIYSTFIAVCGSFSYGCATAYSSPAQAGIMEDLGLSVAEYSLIASIVTIGGMIGAIFSGKIATLLGRRYTMGLSGLFCTIGWLLIAIGVSSWWLDAGRLLIGLGNGVILYVVPVYIAEITTKSVRGTFLAINQASENPLVMTCGFSMIYFMGNIISWRALVLIGAIPSFMQVIGLFCIQESPRWLAKAGKEKEFEAALQSIRGKGVNISKEAMEIKENLVYLDDQSNPGTFALFQKRYSYSLIAGVGLMLLQQLGGSSGIAYYASSIFKKADFSTVIGTTTISLVQIPAAVFAVFLLDISGRKPFLYASSGGMCLCSFLLGLSFYFQESHQLENITPIFAFIGLVGYISTYAIGMAGIPWIIMSEIFPIDVKASAGSIVTFINWSSSWLITYIFNFMLEWSHTGTFFIFGGVCGFTVLFIWKLVPETKGRALEEIHASMSGLETAKEQIV
ncbi:hypothetical protein Tsubulata_032091 [Turnera subulata]|uniref:Major facilitator superfamily (MFS) profile domain-containing protein n=1 Tax=Turnera subulata TaxID=218843 RepID=A0A9Q0F300_9ROSI|nr:hypothetical protein Tsubulata_032091 [Turnera subulata]